MKPKIISIAIATIIAVIFFFYAVRPGPINMLGYSISLFILPENSGEHLKYERTIIYSFDVICGILVFWGVYKSINGIPKL
jgi:hypothetical protein